MKELTLPEGLKQINKEAFWNAGFESIDIPKKTTAIGLYAFQSCEQLKTVTIKGTIKQLDSTFQSCHALETVKFDAAVKAVKSAPFNYCESLKTINVPAGTTDQFKKLLPANQHSLIVDLPAEKIAASKRK
jgi:hypothetical protein